MSNQNTEHHQQGIEVAVARVEEKIDALTNIMTAHAADDSHKFAKVVEYIDAKNKDHEDRIRKAESKINWAIGGGSVAGTIFGLGVSLTNVWHNMFGH